MGFYAAAKTSIAAETRRPTKHMRRSLESVRRGLRISSPFTGRRVNRNGSATHDRTKRNSRGACTQEVRNSVLTTAGPLISSTSMRVAPRLKKPSRAAVKTENAVSKPFLSGVRSGGVQRTFPIIRGYANERATGMQLFKKINDIRASLPKPVAARTGATTRKPIRINMNSRKGKEMAVTSAPAREPRAKATRVALNAISMNFMASPLSTGLLPVGVG